QVCSVEHRVFTPKALHNTAQVCSVEHRVFTPKALHNTAQVCSVEHRVFTPKALHNTAQVCSVEHRVFTPKALHNTAQGRASAPWEKNATGSSTPKGLHRPIPPLVQPLRGRSWGQPLFPGCAGATLGYAVKRLRRRAKVFYFSTEQDAACFVTISLSKRAASPFKFLQGMAGRRNQAAVAPRRHHDLGYIKIAARIDADPMRGEEIARRGRI